LGHARVISTDETALLESLKTPGYRARVERGLLIEVAAYDWNCPQHITPRFTEAEIEKSVAPLRAHLAQLEAELKMYRESAGRPR
jgi:predicted pyridoxine 5'-phosphate oxidase superfamily flavin-nucleotide-binding protein